MKRYNMTAKIRKTTTLTILLLAFGLPFLTAASLAAQEPAGPSTATALQSASPTTATARTAPEEDGTFVDQVNSILETARNSFGRIGLLQWIEAFLAILLGFIFQKIVHFFLRRKALTWAKKTKYEFDQILVKSITRPAGLFPITLGFILAGYALGFRFFLEDAPETKSIFGNATVTILVVNVAWLLFNLVDVVTHFMRGLAKRTDTALDDQLVPLIGKALKTLVVIMGVVTLGSWVGGPFRGILAGLSLGGLAFALAAKDTIANLFGYFVIYLDRPFLLGDRVKILDVYGNIEEIGLRSTRIRTRIGTLTSIPNSEVATASIENFEKRPTRRAEMIVGLTYDTTPDQMDAIVEDIREILNTAGGIEKGTFVIGFQDFGASSLDIRIRLFTHDTRLAGHLKARQAVNLAIMRAVEKRGLSMAFPTRTLYLRQDPDGVPLLARDDQATNL